MTEKDLPALSIADLQSFLRRREISAREVVDALRARIVAVDGELGAYLSLDLAAAARLRARAPRTPRAGEGRPRGLGSRRGPPLRPEQHPLRHEHPHRRVGAGQERALCAAEAGRP